MADIGLISHCLSSSTDWVKSKEGWSLPADHSNLLDHSKYFWPPSLEIPSVKVIQRTFCLLGLAASTQQSFGILRLRLRKSSYLIKKVSEEEELYFPGCWLVCCSSFVSSLMIFGPTFHLFRLLCGLVSCWKVDCGSPMYFNYLRLCLNVLKKERKDAMKKNQN